MFTNLQYWLLKRIKSGSFESDPAERPVSRLDTLFGSDFVKSCQGQTIIDFGCGYGSEVIALARSGARRVIGIDIREEMLDRCRQVAEESRVERVCHFTRRTNELADLVISIDAFEHFADPVAMLEIMSSVVKPGGAVLISFGPTWYHPLGGHLFSVFPWAHLIFSEAALIKWRSDFKDDGATRISEVAGGLNRMTIARFEQVIRSSRLECVTLELVPIRPLRRFHCRVSREFATAVVRCKLLKKPVPGLPIRLPNPSFDRAQAVS